MRFTQINESPEGQMLYHGTGSQDAAKAILKKGLQPPDLTGKNNHLTPVAGKVYLTPDLLYATIYAFGGNFSSSHYDDPKYQVRYTAKTKDMFEFLMTSRGKDSRYGYVFCVPKSSLGHVQPDEDEIGELYSLLLNGGPSKYHSASDHAQWAKAQGTQLTRFKWFMDSITTDIQKRKIKDGEVSYFAHVGKKAVKKMSQDMLGWLVSLDMHVAHDGAVMPTECWQFDKTKIGWLKKDVSNFFELAKRIR